MLANKIITSDEDLLLHLFGNITPAVLEKLRQIEQNRRQYSE
jgi:hypothetical protein